MIIDFVVVIAYLTGMLAVGVICYKKTNSSEQYLVAGRNLGFSLFFPCMASLLIGGGATLSVTKLGYLYGISGGWLVWAVALGIVLMGFFLGSKLTNLRIYTISQLMRIKYGPMSSYLSSVAVIIYLFMILVVQIISIGTILHTLLGWNLTVAMIVGGAVCIIYSYLGGMYAITLTDIIQWVIMTVGVGFFFLPKALASVGGIAGLKNGVDATFFDLTTIGWNTIIAFFVMYTLGTFVGQDIWQRMLTAKNAKVAIWGNLATGIYALLWGMACATIGICAVVLLPGLENPQSAFPAMAMEILPHGLLGLVLAGILSAIMSTFSGPLLSTATTIVEDLVIPIGKKQYTDKQKLVVVRIALVCIGLTSFVVAFWIRDIIAALDVAFAILSGAVFFPLMMSMFWKRGTSAGATVSIIASSMVIIYGLATQGLTATNPILWGVAVSIVTFIIASLLSKPDSEDNLKEWEIHKEKVS